ncbi:hypothetical protein T4C_8670 [Trichinella pseudospiralis]|uniref:Uncharacterized protein n=1 Tax=Trichinella pseudospiralis TaxID=6337 RepID=A0A0V1JND1_TRIPS|nr:hypothetical protein T4C_8670 [Trichinella pseudospiralis]
MLMNPEGYSYIRCSSNKNGLQVYSENMKVSNRCKYTEHSFSKRL